MIRSLSVSATLHARRWAALAALLLAGMAWQLAWSSEAQDAEYRIKAAFLCKFGNYVEWPDLPASAVQAPFEVGVFATPSVADELVIAARTQTVNGRPIVVRRLERSDSIDGLSLIFVARSHAARLAEVLAVVKDRPVLTVTETDPGTATGSMVNFIVVDDKVKFDISLSAAERGKLRISARLLGVARSVTGRPS